MTWTTIATRHVKSHQWQPKAGFSISAARDRFDAGTHTLAQRRDLNTVYLMEKPLEEPCRFAVPYFAKPKK